MFPPAVVSFLPRSRPRLEIAFVLGALGLVCWFIYGQVARFDFIIFDDPGYARDNPHVQAGLCAESLRWAFTSCEFANWHPLTWLSLILDGQLYGAWAGGFHLTNGLLHFLNSVLLFFWLRAAAGGDDFRPAALVALLFAAHPMHVESVAWVTERKDVLSTCFFLLTLCAYTRYARRAGGNRRVAYAAALALFTLGLMAKPMLVTVPPLLLLLDYWPLQRLQTPWRRRLWEKAPFAALAAISAVITCLAQRHAEIPLAAFPFRWRLAHAGNSYGEYLLKTVWPVDLAIPYPFSASIPWWSLGSGAAALLAGTFVVWRLRRTRPCLIVGWLWFLGTLVPVIGLVQVGNQRIADRYVYLPHIGLFFALSFLAFGLPLRGRWLRPVLLPVFFACVTAALAILGREQAALWRNSVTLFEHSLEINGPGHHQSNRLLAQGYLEAKNLPAARTYADQALRLWSDHVPSLDLAATVHSLQGDWAGAIAPLQALAEKQPGHAEAWNRLGLACAQAGRPGDARAAFERAVQIRPENVPARLNLARVLEQAGGESVAVAWQLEEILALDSGNREALRALAWLRATSADAAVRNSQRALALADRIAAADGSGSLAALDCQAAAFAGLGRWAEADLAAQAALARVQGSAVPAEIARHAKLLELYRARKNFWD